MDTATGVAISSVASTVGVVLVAYIAFRQAQITKKVDVVQEQTNGILLAATAAKAKAEGKAEAAVEITTAVAVAAVIKQPEIAVAVSKPPKP